MKIALWWKNVHVRPGQTSEGGEAQGRVLDEDRSSHQFSRPPTFVAANLFDRAGLYLWDGQVCVGQADHDGRLRRWRRLGLGRRGVQDGLHLTQLVRVARYECYAYLLGFYFRHGGGVVAVVVVGDDGDGAGDGGGYGDGVSYCTKLKAYLRIAPCG